MVLGGCKMNIGYCTKFKLGEKVKPITQEDECPIMTICAIQIVQAQNAIRETYQVDYFDGAFHEVGVEAHQIKKNNEKEK